jgi:hypothetical protein
LTNDAAVREKNPQWFGGDPTIQEVVDRISEARGGNPISLNNSSIAEAQQAFAPRPVVANANIFKNLSSLRDNVDFPIIDAARTEAIQNHAKWAILDKNQLTPEALAAKTPLELRKIWVDAQKDMPKQLAQDAGAKALMDAMERAGVDTSSLSSKKSAREATVFQAVQAFTQRIANPAIDILSINSRNVAKQTGIPVKTVNTILSSKQVPALLDKFMTKMRSDPKYGSSNESKVFTINPDSGVEEYNRAMKAFKKEYSHISNAQWNDLETDAQALLSIKSATTAAALKKKDRRGLDTQHTNNTVKLHDDHDVISAEHDRHSVYTQFPNISRNAIDDAAEILSKKVIFPNIGKGTGSRPMLDSDKSWILHQAMKKVGSVNQNYLIPNTFETGDNLAFDKFQNTIVEDIRQQVNILVKRHSRATGRAVIGSTSEPLLGSILDLPKFPAAAKSK